MKKFITILLAVLMALLLIACSSQGGADDTVHEDSLQTPSDTESDDRQPSETSTTPSEEEPDADEMKGGKILVAYFSATSNTEGVAQKLAEGLGADIYEIVPEQPYTDEDLDYGNRESRSSAEMNDHSARPAISGSVANIDQYDVMFLGYPIWWGEAPRIMSTFVESYDFSGKTLVPFCTSGNSGFGSSDSALREAAESATWLEGRRFSAGASSEEIMEWADGLSLNTTESNGKEQTIMQLKIGDAAVSVEWESNESVEALKDLCKNDPLKIPMSMYGGFEQVGSLGRSLPRNDAQTTTDAGDIVLYAGDQIVVFYGSNSWAYTRLGAITDKTASEMKELLGNGDVTITISGGTEE